MQPNHYDLLSQVQPDEPQRAPRDAHHRNPFLSRSPSGVAPTRSEDSWIEVASQPSSSSLSSIATNDDIITTGLRVEQHGSRSYHHRNRRRRLQRLAAVTAAQVDYSSREQSSSQDEYEESESESDRVMTSSNEDMPQRSLGGPLLAHPGPPSMPDSPSSDEDDASTALGMRISSSPFVPQPNVFTHPPASENPAWTRPVERRRPQPSEVSNSSRQTAIRRNSQASIRPARRQSQQHSPYNMISPSYHADHDAALRSSLSTLLSCAAAARGLPKSDPQPTPPSGPSRAQPASFRLVSESVAMGEHISEEVPTSAVETNTSRRPMHPPVATYSPRSSPSAPKVRRRSSSPREHHASASRKNRRATTADSTASPTIMTWVISAGVVVLFSAISFSAGYVIGREVGRMEASTGVGSVMGDGNFSGGRTSAACGQEAIKGGLKRFRWSSGAAGSGVIA
ncbi:hypothetical protein BDV27DRAFT_147299 [Aspergillus caelatus]|uniref:Uncharacterized protein n=2 Tax=Aspergillus subgen. Circumdati TaxID=2720871 RepID=A0A5N6ZXE7_9EURO|nr:uncharacterized protein BDV27DRAFT_147299 [Aspergillus caelatus]KAE8362075.1 hypothetical protein BDV27DRAFT_147299 [Aspergillus caelatus]KAE8416232.1 hypothetical protein BDV36DRAFT_310259 [Aspergillus pseudocaelatus]